MMGFVLGNAGRAEVERCIESGEKVDGWYGVCAAFKRAFDEGVPVADAKFWKVLQKNKLNIFSALRLKPKFRFYSAGLPF